MIALTALPMADLTATATLVLAGITLVLVVATIVLVTRAGTKQARADARAELRVLAGQVNAGDRPLLVDVLLAAPPPKDMGALYDVTESQGPNATVHHPGPVIETRLPGTEPRLFDPRTAFVSFQAAKIYVSLPLRNVGRGLAVIDESGVELTGALVGRNEYRTIQRQHIPAGETTRVDLVNTYLSQDGHDLPDQGRMRGVSWQLTVPYCDFAGGQRTIARLDIVCHGDDVNGPWLVERVEQEPLRDEKGQERSHAAGELPDAAPSPPIVAKRRRLDVKSEPVTDVWGNPVRPRRRKR